MVVHHDLLVEEVEWALLMVVEVEGDYLCEAVAVLLVVQAPL